MRPLILLALSCLACAATQEEQNEIWRKAMQESAAVTTRPAVPVRIPAPAPSHEPQPQPVNDAARNERDAFERRWGISWRPASAPSVVIAQIPTEMRGKLLIDDDGGRFIAGEITANLISFTDGGGVILDSMDAYGDGSISYAHPSTALAHNAKSATVWLRLSPRNRKYIIETKVIARTDNEAEDDVWNRVYMLVK